MSARMGRALLVFLMLSLVAVTMAFASGTTQKGPVTVTYWTHQNPAVVAFETAKIKEWEAKHPGIKVELAAHGDQLTNDLNLAFQNNVAPDLYRSWMTDRTWVETGRMADLTPVLSKEHLALYKPYLTEGVHTFNGKVYSLPQTAYTFRFIINRDLFRAAGLDPNKPPKTYDQVKEYARKITEYGKTKTPRVYGFCLPVQETWIWEEYADQFSYAAGINPFNWKTLKYEFALQKPVLQMWLDMQAEGTLFPGGTTLANDPARASFAQGVIGMMTGGSWDVSVWNKQFPTNVDWAAVPWPTPDGTTRGKYRIWPRAAFAVNPKSKVLKEATMLMEFLTSVDVLAPLFQEGLGQAVLNDVYKVAKIPQQHGWEGFLTAGVDSPYPVEFAGLPLEGDDRGTAYTALMAGQGKLDEMLLDLDKRYNAAVQKLIDKGTVDPQKARIPNYDPLRPMGN